MDFDSTITEESTLVWLYMLSELFRDKDKRKELENISNEFYAEELKLKAKTYKKLFKCLDYYKFEDFLKSIMQVMQDYERRIIVYEMLGMQLVEPFLKNIKLEDISRASSQIKLREGFSEFVYMFDLNERYIISCNWSDLFINMVCQPNVNRKNIFSNRLAIKKDECSGFDYNEVILTPLVKSKIFNNYKAEKNVYCGDSFPDIMPTLLSDIGFVFESSDKEYASLLKFVKEKYSRNIFFVSDFNEAKSLLKFTWIPPVPP